MPEMQFGSIPGSLMTQSPGKEYLKKMRENRKQLSPMRKDIKENYLNLPACNKIGVTKRDIDKWVEEGKLRKKLFKDKYYYNKEDLMTLLNIWITK